MKITKPITTSICQVWIVQTETVDYIMAVDKSFTMEEFVDLVKLDPRVTQPFKVGCYAAGMWELGKTISALSFDGRKVDQDLEMHLD